ncbi:amidohydrolase family protein [Nakamurella endophytica]|uniref:Xaa-Pro dipeptidase n=1 Tax=Nakamurella endophytica TaxID=1748367 RepID=A0A917SLX2_9ACTN|nr:amidohydrolase family protein [Nakamurella endophytica]GGL85354.1 Xaa-Pro dipeptidase [Nakamurella endophytica]
MDDDAAGRIDGIRIWDGRAELGVGSLAWAAGRLTAVGPPAGPAAGDGAGSAGPAAGADELCVLPGLVDTHVHLGGFAGRKGDPAGRDGYTWPLVTTVQEQTLHVVANAQRAMRSGVTTLRDLAADEQQAAARRVFEAEVLPGPRLQVSGPVGMTAGHLDLFTPPAVRDRPATADGPDACRALVRRWARAGMTGIKIFTSGGVLSIGDRVGWRNHTRAEIAATIDEAHALGMLVACHTHTAEGIDLALEEGADSIEHGSAMTAAQAEVLAERRIPVGPTLLINEVIAERSATGNAEARDAAVEVVAARDRVFPLAAAAGVRFVLGTDASGYFVEFGQQWDELRRMTAVLGWDAERALQAGTSDAAASLGLGELVGRLAPGMAADLVVLRGTPWRDPAHLAADRVVAVVSRGRLVAGSLPAAPAGTR